MEELAGKLETESEDEFVRAYNYDEFLPHKFSRWMRFHESPALLSAVPDYGLTRLSDGSATSLPELCRSHQLTVIEFGSFT